MSLINIFKLRACTKNIFLVPNVKTALCNRSGINNCSARLLYRRSYNENFRGRFLPLMQSFMTDHNDVYALKLMRYDSTNSNDSSKMELSTKKTYKERLKQGVKHYGSIVIVFHIGISLLSLGGFYLALSSGVDIPSLLTKIGFAESVISNKIAVGSSTFVIAYAVHKLFAPVRIGITLTSVPLLVHYLRRIGILKTPKS